MNQLIDPDDRVLYLCDIYRNMTEGGCDGTMCMFGEMFGGDCKHTRKRELSRNYKDHEPTEEDIINCFYRMGNYLIEVERSKPECKPPKDDWEIPSFMKNFKPKRTIVFYKKGEPYPYYTLEIDDEL